MGTVELLFPVKKQLAGRFEALIYRNCSVYYRTYYMHGAFLINQALIWSVTFFSHNMLYYLSIWKNVYSRWQFLLWPEKSQTCSWMVLVNHKSCNFVDPFVKLSVKKTPWFLVRDFNTKSSVIMTCAYSCFVIILVLVTPVHDGIFFRR